MVQPTDTHSKKNSIIMEYANDGDLFQKITNNKKKGVYIDEKEVWSIMTQVISAHI